MGLDNVVGLVRNLMHLSANVGDFGDDGDVPSLWSQLPKIIVVGGQVRGAAPACAECMSECAIAQCRIAAMLPVLRVQTA